MTSRVPGCLSLRDERAAVKTPTSTHLPPSPCGYGGGCSVSLPAGRSEEHARGRAAETGGVDEDALHGARRRSEVGGVRWLGQSSRREQVNRELDAERSGCAERVPHLPFARAQGDVVRAEDVRNRGELGAIAADRAGSVDDDRVDAARVPDEGSAHRAREAVTLWRDAGRARALFDGRAHADHFRERAALERLVLGEPLEDEHTGSLAE